MSDVHPFPPEAGGEMIKRVREFFYSTSANIVPMFAISLLPVIGLVGAAVDYSRANAVNTKLQAALDSTVLAMAANAATQSAAQLQTSGAAYFFALFKTANPSSVDFHISYSTTSSGPRVTASATTSVKTTFMGIPGINIKEMPVTGTAVSAWGNTRLRVALALDNTGSMADSNKMTALKGAATNLINQLQGSANSAGDVYVSIIPFAKDVNVGSSRYNATWLDWDDWEDDNGRDSSVTTCTTSKSGKSGRTTKKCSTSTSWIPNNHNTWNGCVTDRDQPYDTQNDAPSTANSGKTLFPTEQYDDCPVELLPLTYDWTALKNKITSMTPRGNTNTTIGLEWAWHSLTQGSPLNAPAEASGYQYNKVIIFLTDGANTANRWDDSRAEDDDGQKKIDDRMKKACDNVKKAGIIVYTIQVIDGNDALLQKCASDPKKYFKITNSNQIVSVFSQIATTLSRLRVAQ